MKLISAATIATTIFLLQDAVKLASALDMRFYFALNCSGGWIQCGNLAPGFCCYSDTVPAAALRLTSVSGVADFSGWGSQTCSGPLAVSASSTGCKPATFAFYSGNYRSSLGLRAEPTTKTRIASRAPADCVQPDSFGFVDENGEEHITKITGGNRKAVYAALAKSDVATLKVEAAAVA
ncbi:hypothetical protein EST38_g11160 [Candolleomyces aberdarensis]|uniref:Uncharacterized protein n=1 Tax=Candolleomyces aberdarensis TaxID=2316362 RepID=A0A4Q2D680_9AGAR|nr:hypothetical protein EST38_g11160 [Candolleomyces aberdarensis]